MPENKKSPIALDIGLILLGLLSLVYLLDARGWFEGFSSGKQTSSETQATDNGKAETAGQSTSDGSPTTSPNQDSAPIRIGWTAWGDAEIVTHVTKLILEERMGYEVQLVMADVGILYQGVADGSLDAMLMGWLPITHQNYWKRFSGKLVNLGPIYTGAMTGWVVPNYVPRAELETVSDLSQPEVQKKLNFQIQGIDPGAGLMQASEHTLEAYDLENMQLISASGAAMTAALDRAIRRQEWIVVTAWNPHWIFAKWDLRYLKDPKQALGTHERVHALVRPGFDADFPDEVTDLLTRMYIPLPDLEEALLESTKSSPQQAARHFIDRHSKRVEYWLSGELPDAF